MVKIWIDQDEYYLLYYAKTPSHGTEVEISEDKLKILEEASNKFTEAYKILVELMKTTLVEEGFGDPPSIWP